MHEVGIGEELLAQLRRVENEHIWVHEMQQRIVILAKEQQEKTDAEKQQLKEAHWMHCPKCGQKLAAELCGPLEIDVCPSCKGVWLDMGELGSIVESSDQGGFFQKCLQIMRKDNPTSPHLSTKPGMHRPD